MSAPNRLLVRAPLALALASGTSALALSLAAPSTAEAACVLAAPAPMATGNNPPSGATVNCVDNLDTEGVVNQAATGVTVNVQSPAGGISTTGQPGVLLGSGTTVNVTSEGGSNRPINTSGDNAPGIDVTSGAAITVDGQVMTAGGTSPAIRTTDNANVTVGTTGRVSTGGGTSPAITVGGASTVTLLGGGGDVGATVTTGNSMSDAVVLGGPGSTLTVQDGASVTTSSGMSNPVEVRAANGTVNVAGDVRSSAGNATAILGTQAATGLSVNVMQGGFVTAQSSGSNAIESQATGAQINVMQGGEVRISAGNSAAIVSGEMGMVTVGGTVGASSSQSQGVVLGNGGMLTVTDSGVIETSSSESQAVRVADGAASANVTVQRGGNINAVGAQAILDPNMNTATTVDVSGTVFGGASAPVIDLGGGADTVTVNEGGSVTGTGGAPVVSLGAGNDRLDVLATNGLVIQGNAGTLADGGAGADTLNLQTGGTVDAARFAGFETTNVGANPTTGAGTTAEVNQGTMAGNVNAGQGGTVNVNQGGMVGNATTSGGTVNVNQGGQAGVTADNAAGTGSGQGGGAINFNPGSTANVTAGGGARETQNVTGATFNGATVAVGNSDLITGRASGSRIDLDVDPNAFSTAAAARAPRNGNAVAVAAAIDSVIAVNPNVLDAAIASGQLSLLTTDQNTVAFLSRLSGEMAVQAAVGGIQAALAFTDSLRPGGLGGGVTPTIAPTAYTAPAATAPAAPAEGEYFADVIAPTAVNLAPAAETGVWIGGFGVTFDVDEGLGAPYDGDALGVALGVERAMDFGPLTGGTAGIAVGYSHTDVDNPFDTADVDAYHMGAYVDGQAGIFQAEAAIAYSYLDIEGDAVLGANGTTGFDTDAHVFTSRLDAAVDAFALSRFTLGPVGRLEYTYASIDATGPLGPLNTTLAGGDLSQFVAGIGGRAAVEIGAGTARVDVVYEHVFGDEALVFNGNVAGAPFAVGAAATGDDRLRVGAGYDLRVGPAEVGLRYDGTFSDVADVHSGSVRATFRF